MKPRNMSSQNMDELDEAKNHELDPHQFVPKTEENTTSRMQALSDALTGKEKRQAHTHSKENTQTNIYLG